MTDRDMERDGLVGSFLARAVAMRRISVARVSDETIFAGAR
ncbi:MAG: hypothetical protein V1899_07935 [Planctomycetota bacterium]